MRKTLPVLSLAACLATLSGIACSSGSEAPAPDLVELEPSLAENVAASPQTDGRADADHGSASAVATESNDAAQRMAHHDRAAESEAKPRRSMDKKAGARSGASAAVGIYALGSVDASPEPRAQRASRRAVRSEARSGGGHARGSKSMDRPSSRARTKAARRSVRSEPSPRASRKYTPKPKLAVAPPPTPPRADPVFAEQDTGGTFQHAGTNPFVVTSQDKLSTFSIDVDTASYTYARRFLKAGNRPHASSVRVEEWINAFHYEYQGPTGKHPFQIHMEAGPSPLQKDKHLLRVGIQGKRIRAADRKPVHLTFLVDTSGSMRRADKLPLAQRAMHHLVDNLNAKDSVALITYAGSTSEVLSQTSARHKQRIHKAIDQLMAGGGTAMGSGMEMAYRNAGKFVAPDSVSRVIVLSDGDANIGRTTHRDILESIKGYVSEGIKMSTVGFGTGNYRDHLMEQLADAGDGNYSYIDSFAAAKKTFGTDLSGTLQVIAKDVKIQVEMNPKVVKRYRLLGYENRDIADKDFRNDKVDAGEIGAGHSVTALYEVELQDPYGSVKDDVATVRVRYKQPRGMKATEVARTFTNQHVRTRFGDLSRDTRWAAAVSVASEVLRGSPYARDTSLEDAWALAAEAAGGKYAKERREFIDLLDLTVKRGAVAVR